MLYYAMGNAIITQKELETTRKIPDFSLYLEHTRNISKSITYSIHFPTGTLSNDNIIPFEPIGLGKPLTIMIRQIYTGKYPEKVMFTSPKDMMITSAIKSFSSMGAKPHALNYIKKNVPPYSVITRPKATDEGTPIIFYTPSLVDKSLTLDLTIVFDSIDEELFTHISQAFETAAGIPVFLPASSYLLVIGNMTKILGKTLEKLFDGQPAFTSSDALDFFLAGSEPVPTGFALITPDNIDVLDPSFRKKYHINKEGKVLDENGNQYQGDIPFIVISFDGTSMPELENFIPTAASTSLLSRFLGKEDGKKESMDILIEAVKMYNDKTYREQADTINEELLETTDAEKKEKLKNQRDAFVANITNKLMKPSYT